MSGIRSAAVIGAGTMGSGIASHLANAGISVCLLDVPGTGGESRSHVAEQAVARQLRARPPAFFHPDCAKRITVGNITDDLHRVADVDWIAEAVVERLEVKEALYRAIEEYRTAGTPISSNTSTIPLSLLTRNQPASFTQDFCITHFFNPVRHMRLLEVVAGPTTRPGVVALLTEFCDHTLGKAVVACKDTPGFLGNRVGVFAIQVAIVEAMQMGLTVEEADAIMGRPVGWPKTGVFRLYDLIGLDLMLDVLKSMRDVVAHDDAFHDVASEIPLIRRLVDDGCTGDKGLGGFYRQRRSDNGAVPEAIDLRTGDYRPRQNPTSAAVEAAAAVGLRALVEHPDLHGQFAWRVLSRTLCYAASLVPDVSHDIVPIDEAMKMGFSWSQGPFELIDELGVDWFSQRLDAENVPVPVLLRAAAGSPLYRGSSGRLQHVTIGGDYRDVERPAGVLRLTDRTKANVPLLQGAAASLWDLGDGVACFEFHTKANALVPDTMDLLAQAIGVVRRDYQALVIHNDSPHFSVGVNIQHVLENARGGAWSEIEQMLVDFQQTCKQLKYAPFPVISAPSGLSLGGGFEVLLHSDAVVAHTNSITGLVETNVGLIPAGGGCKEMLFRWSAASPTATALATDVFKIIGRARMATSPLEAEPCLFLLPRDTSVMNRDRILAAAKADALAMSVDYEPPAARTVAAAGADGLEAIEGVLDEWDEARAMAPHERVVARQLARVLCGGDAPAGQALTEDRLFDLERDAFMTLVKTPETLARIEHTLTTGKPLRN